MNNMPTVMLNLISQLFITYTFWRLIRKVLWNKALEWKHYAALITFFVGHSVIFTVWKTEWFYYFFLAVLLLFFALLQNGNLKCKLSYFLITYVLCTFGKLIFTIEGNENYLLSTGVLLAWFLFESELIVETMICKQRKTPKNTEWYALCFVPVITYIAIVAIEFYMPLELNMKIMLVIFSYWLNVFIFYFYETMLGYYEEILENHQVIFQQKLYETRMENLIKNEKEMSAFRHDLKNHLFALNIMANQGETEKIKAYLQDMDIELSKSSLKRFSSNKDIDMLLNYFVNKAQSANVILSITADLPADLQWNMYDLNIILSNLIDNALEAVEKISEKEIRLHIKYQKGILKLKIENVYDGICQIEEGRYLTTKDEKTGIHGYGLGNVRKIVEKYSGTMDIESSDYLFVVKILLFQN